MPSDLCDAEFMSELDAARNKIYEYEKEIKFLKAMNVKLDFELKELKKDVLVIGKTKDADDAE